MKQTLKIAVGILISVALFYVFIKDVNKIHVVLDSGLNHGFGDEVNRVIYIADADNFETGDVIRITSNQLTNGQTYRVEKVISVSQHETPPYIVTEKPISVELKLDEQPIVHFPRLQRALVRANYWWILPSLTINILALVVRAYRWKFFFLRYEKIKFQSLWRSVCIGYMANNVLPFRIGEFVRAWFFGRKENRPASEVFATIVLERIFDILSILILYVAFVFYFATLETVNLPKEMIYGAWVMAVIALGSLASLIALRYWTSLTRRVIRFFLNWFPDKFSKKANQMIDAFVEGLWIFNSPRCILTAFGLSMIIWLVLALAYLFVFYAVGIECSLMVSLFLIVALAFAVSIPSAPGFIGTFHWVGQQVLLMMGLKGNIEAYVLLAHLLAYIPVVILGFFYLSLENISWKELRSSVTEIAAETGAETE